MSVMIPLMMFGWIPFTLWLFSRLQPRHAVIAAIVLSWMFLPQFTYTISGIPNYDRIAAMSYGILLGTLIYNPQILSRFRLHPLDLPIIIFCSLPMFTSISNGLGAYDGLSAVLGRSVQWGFPYFIARLYFTNRQHLSELAFGIFVAGLIYMPFTLYEIVMSPQLHIKVYGFFPHDFNQTRREGGWRPQVFMEHGLMTAMWMITAFLAGYQLFRSGWLQQHFPAFRTVWLPALGMLFITIVLSKSKGALFLMLFGIVLIHILQITGWRITLYLVLTLPILYMIGRGSGHWDGELLVTGAARISDPERVGSLEYRLYMETILADKARERFLLGWGGFGRSFVRDDDGKVISVPDGLWILIFGYNGAIGLSALLAMLITPPLVFLRLYPPITWRDPSVAAILSLPVLILLFALDSLLNAMFNPTVLLFAGGIISTYISGDEGALEKSSAPIEILPPPTRIF